MTKAEVQKLKDQDGLDYANRISSLQAQEKAKKEKMRKDLLEKKKAELATLHATFGSGLHGSGSVYASHTYSVPSPAYGVVGHAVPSPGYGVVGHAVPSPAYGVVHGVPGFNNTGAGVQINFHGNPSFPNLSSFSKTISGSGLGPVLGLGPGPGSGSGYGDGSDTTYLRQIRAETTGPGSGDGSDTWYPRQIRAETTGPVSGYGYGDGSDTTYPRQIRAETAGPVSGYGYGDGSDTTYPRQIRAETGPSPPFSGNFESSEDQVVSKASLIDDEIQNRARNALDKCDRLFASRSHKVSAQVDPFAGPSV
jgi:hypothetical protein